MVEVGVMRSLDSADYYFMDVLRGDPLRLQAVTLGRSRPERINIALIFGDVFEALRPAVLGRLGCANS